MQNLRGCILNRSGIGLQLFSLYLLTVVTNALCLTAYWVTESIPTPHFLCCLLRHSLCDCLSHINVLTSRVQEHYSRVNSEAMKVCVHNT